MTLPGIEQERGIGDALDRCYTPHKLARAVVDSLSCDPDRIVEPSAGGGSFVLNARDRWPDAIVTGVDVDPDAAARLRCDLWISGDWTKVVGLRSWKPDLILGNPPFGEALAHVEHALTFGCTVAFILPWAYWGVQAWAPLLDRHPPAFVRPIRGRPWPAKVRETAVFEWHPMRDLPCTQVVPLVGWPR